MPTRSYKPIINNLVATWTWITCLASWFTPMKIYRTSMIFFALGCLKHISLGVNCKTPGDDMVDLSGKLYFETLTQQNFHQFFTTDFFVFSLSLYEFSKGSSSGLLHLLRFLVGNPNFSASFVTWGCQLMSCHLPVVEFAYDTWYQGGVFPKTFAQQQRVGCVKHAILYMFVLLCWCCTVRVLAFLVFVGGGGTAYLRYILPVVVQAHKIMHVEIIVCFLLE